MKWWRRLTHRNGRRDAAAAREQEAKLRAAQRMTPVYEQMAEHLARLPPEEFAARVAQAFRRST